MDVSSSTESTVAAIQTEVLKKSIDVAERSVLKILESSNEQSKQVTAQKTGLGNSLNITG